MKARSDSAYTWGACLLIMAVGLFGEGLFAQAPTDSADSSSQQQQQTSDKDKKPAPKAEAKQPQPDLGVAVDAGRKSDVLATWITTEHNQGELGGPWLVKQSAEFGGRITDF